MVVQAPCRLDLGTAFQFEPGDGPSHGVALPGLAHEHEVVGEVQPVTIAEVVDHTALIEDVDLPHQQRIPMIVGDFPDLA